MEKAITTNKVNLKELIKTSEGEIIILQDYNSTKDQLIEQVKKHQNIIVTTENYNKSAKESWREVRNLRLSVQAVLKHNKGLLNKAKTQMDHDFSLLIDELKPTEDKLNESIKEIDASIKEEKIRKLKEEEDRIKEIQNNLLNYRIELKTLIEHGKNMQDFEKYIELKSKLSEHLEDDVFMEFGYEAQNIIDYCNENIGTFKDRIDEIKKQEIRSKEIALENRTLKRKLELMKIGFEEVGQDLYERSTNFINGKMILTYDDEMFQTFINEMKAIIKDEKLQEQLAKEKVNAEINPNNNLKTSQDEKEKIDSKIENQKGKKEMPPQPQKNEKVVEVNSATTKIKELAKEIITVSEDKLLPFEYARFISETKEFIKNI